MHDRLDRSRSAPSSRSARRIVSALLLLPALGCVMGGGSLGDYTETDTSTSTGTSEEPSTGADDDSGSSGEPSDPSFAIGYIRGVSSLGQTSYWLGTATCIGPSCPASVSPVDSSGTPIESCIDSAAAQASPLGAAEHCRITAGWLANHFQIGFTTPVDHESYEELRTQLGGTTAKEAYRWHPEVVAVEGPGAVVRGDYFGDVDGYDRFASVENETCAARLTALGTAWTTETLEELCVGTWDDGGVLRPLRMAPSMTFTSFDGQLSTHLGASCDDPDEGLDTCCSECDRLLGPQVARYGVEGSGERRNANAGTAIACDPAGDVLVECRDLVLAVERDPGLTYTYAWDGAEQEWSLPRFDKLRETHPDQRPAGLEDGRACSTTDDCGRGQQCVGTNAAGDACLDGPDCAARACRAEWFGGCEITAGDAAFCIDRRFQAESAAACMVATTDFTQGVTGDRLALCDVDGNGEASPAECCDPALGGAPDCDPFYQPNLVAVARHDRWSSLGEAACVCEEGQPESCNDAVEAWCEAPLGMPSDPDLASAPGDYAAPAVIRKGGLTRDEDRDWLDLTLALDGAVPRAPVEFCAELGQQIGGLDPADGWLGTFYDKAEIFEDHDRVLCSGSSYRFSFAESDAEHHLRSLAGETLDGRSEHVIETPQFRVIPHSVRPLGETDAPTCLQYSLDLGNAFDPSGANVRKLELRKGAQDGPLVAGGPSCDPEATATEVAAGAIPCIEVWSYGFSPTLFFRIDAATHGPVLVHGTTYYAVLPGLASIEQMADAEAYAAAFHDVCGMPLVVGQTDEELALTELSFSLPEPCV